MGDVMFLASSHALRVVNGQLEWDRRTETKSEALTYAWDDGELYPCNHDQHFFKAGTFVKKQIRFIHGYDVGPDDALKFSLGLQKLADSWFPGEFLVVPYLWRTSDNWWSLLFDYWRDRRGAVTAAKRLRQLDRVMDQRLRLRTHVVAHSMGSRVWAEMCRIPRRLDARYRTVQLVAADIPARSVAPGGKYRMAIEVAKDSRVIHSLYDLALITSGWLPSNRFTERLGLKGYSPANPHESTMNVGQAARRADPKLGHSYFGGSTKEGQQQFKKMLEYINSKHRKESVKEVIETCGY